LGVKKKLLLGGVIAAAALGFLLFFLFRSTTPYVMPVSQFMAEKSKYEGKTIRLEGSVVNDTIDWTSGDYTLKFFLQESGQRVLVFYDGQKPDKDKFIGGIKLMVGGKYRQGILIADSFSYECPSEYKDK
jgi:cytochrome c-type biogenesis protein CcmE